ncbi:hypothetical protein [Prevotella ihumii]|nr:hypothetical protein [Prevotella ihumii]
MSDLSDLSDLSDPSDWSDFLTTIHLRKYRLSSDYSAPPTQKRMRYPHE